MNVLHFNNVPICDFIINSLLLQRFLDSLFLLMYDNFKKFQIFNKCKKNKEKKRTQNSHSKLHDNFRENGHLCGIVQAMARGCLLNGSNLSTSSIKWNVYVPTSIEW